MRILLNKIDDIKEFVKEAWLFESPIRAKSGRADVDGKSVLGLYSLNLSEPIEVNIITNNDSEVIRFYKLLEPFRI